MTANDEVYLKDCLRLAQKGRGWTNPNPMVGCVIVKNGRVVARGWHRRVGGAHAEVEALAEAGSRSRGATLYVNLEPCCHFGRTPPCTTAIIKVGIKRVVCCTLDPNPRVSGKGRVELERAGIKVTVGSLEAEARQLNEAFFTFHQKKRPFIALKFAASLDGKIATRTGESKWITGELARRLVMGRLWRTYQAVLVGSGTVVADDEPMQAEREPRPLRIVLDSRLRVPVDSRFFGDSRAVVVTSEKADKKKRRQLVELGVEVVKLGRGKQGFVDLEGLMDWLYKRQIVSVLVEGGARVLGSFRDAGLVDKVYAFYAPVLIGGEEALGAIGGLGAGRLRQALRLKEVKLKRLGEDWLVEGKTTNR